MNWKEAYKKKIIPPEEIEEKVAHLKSLGKTIATLNGSFDLLHAGHLHMLFEASKQADILILALNTDRSIQEYKSKDRPIIPLEYRLQMLSALSFIDYLTYFDETTPIKTLEKIKPNVHVNGSEYGKDCIEAPTILSNGGKIHIVDLIEGLSTTQIVKKIHSLPQDKT
jgi:rfaE bifunctional protein nucleotidyltransferase chain/domain